ncbi:MAG: hypothetical protein ACREBE_13315, partial [bacterium]
MRTGLRVLAFLLAIPLLLGGFAGFWLARGGDRLATELKARVKVEASQRGAAGSSDSLGAGLDGAQSLRSPVLHFGMIGSAAALVVFGLLPVGRRRARSKAPAKKT